MGRPIQQTKTQPVDRINSVTAPPPLHRYISTFEEKRMSNEDELKHVLRNPGDLFGRRFVASLLDGAVICASWLGMGYLLSSELYEKTWFVWIGIITLYYPLSEFKYSATIGKKICGLKVVRMDRRKLTYKEPLIRFLARIVEANPFVFLGLPSIIAFIASERRQRLGDIMAKTLVVRAEDVKLSNQSSEAIGTSSTGPDSSS